MWTAFNKIDEAVRSLNIPEERFQQLSEQQSWAALERIKMKYLGGFLPDLWWEHYADAEAHQPAEPGFTLLKTICPEHDIYFIAHDDNKHKIYKSNVDTVTQILGECPAFEYTIAGKNLDWLITENHHDYIVAVGYKAKVKLNRLNT
jgi:hypothetical protein